MRLPNPPKAYDAQDQAQVRRALEQADAKNIKSGSSIEVGEGRIVLMAPNGSRWALAVSNAGVVSTVVVP